MRRIFCSTILGLLTPAALLSAQRVDSSQTVVRRTVRSPSDTTIRPPVSPRRAFFYSLAVPGLGQSKLNRPTAGALYFAVEVGSLAMALKTANDLRVAKAHQSDSIANNYKLDAQGIPIRTDSGAFVIDTVMRNRYAGQRVRARRQHLEDWIAAMAFTHLFAAADAFVAANLWDLPAQVGFTVAPRHASFSVRLPFRRAKRR